MLYRNPEVRIRDDVPNLKNQYTQQESSHSVALAAEDVETILAQGVPALEDAIQQLSGQIHPIVPPIFLPLRCCKVGR